MSLIKSKKRKKSSRHHGMNMGTHGSGARKNKKKSGHKGGKGMAGSGKRADHKKTLVNTLYGHNYFGKQGITSRGTKRDTRQRINLEQIELYLDKYTTKKSGDKFEINLKKYKILGTGNVKNKLIITAKEASKSAIEKVKKAGGEIILPVKPKKRVYEIPKRKSEGKNTSKEKKIEVKKKEDSKKEEKK